MQYIYGLTWEIIYWLADILNKLKSFHVGHFLLYAYREMVEFKLQQSGPEEHIMTCYYDMSNLRPASE